MLHGKGNCLTQEELNQALLDNGIDTSSASSPDHHHVDIPIDGSINQQVTQASFSANTWLNIVIEAGKPLVWPVAYNFVRDAVWAPITQQNINYTGQPDSDDTDSQMYGQWLFSTAAMLGLFALKFGISYAVAKIKGNDIDEKFKKEIYTDLKTIAGASLAIVFWDLAAGAGIKFYQDRGCDAITAGYYAVWTPGLAEGPTQYLVPKLVDGIVDLLTTREGTTKFFSDPVLALKKIMYTSAGVAVNATLGSIPGDVWQLVYNRCLEKGYSPELTATLVSIAVGGCNIVYGLSYNVADKKFLPQETTEKKDQLAGSSITTSNKITLHG